MRLILKYKRRNMIIVAAVKKVRKHSLSCLSVCSFAVAVFFFNTHCFSAQISVTWSPNIEKNIAGYKVYYGDSSRNYNNSIDVGSRTSYTISNLREGNTYFIGITAYDFNGNESGYSDEIRYDASTPVNNSPLESLEGTQKTLHTKRTNDGFVYAAKHSRVVHLPDCEKLISGIEGETKKGETVQASDSKIDALHNQITQIEKEITELRKKYFDEYPKIVQRKKQITGLEKQIEEESLRNVNKQNINKNPGSNNLLETENVVTFPSLEEAMEEGAVACPVCNP